MRTHFRKYFYTFFIGFCFLPGAGQSGERSGHNPGNLAPTGSQSVSLFTGAFTYNYPIQIPAGRNGLQPSINLIYNSQAGNGWLGVGWDLSFGSIQRSTKDGVPSFDDNTDTFLFSLAGSSSELVFIEASNDSHGAYREYRAQLESSFMRFRYYNTSPDREWWVWSTDGTKYEFGKLAHQEGVSWNGTYWVLAKVTDLHGNYMEFTYTVPVSGGSCGFCSPSGGSGMGYVPREIKYTGYNSGLTPSHRIEFDFEDRPDKTSNALTGTLFEMTKRLKKIDVYTHGSLLRQYQLSYTENAARSSLLSSITMYAPGGNSLPPTVFDYKEPNFTFSGETHWSVAGSPDNWDINFSDSNGNTHVVMMDMNGDSLPDHVYKIDTEDSFRVRFNNGTGFDPEDSRGMISGGNAWHLFSDILEPANGKYNRYGIVKMIDINGDNLPDHVYKSSTTTDKFKVHLNLGYGFSAQQNWMIAGSPDSWYLSTTDGQGHTSVSLMDINGDGFSDHIYKVPGEDDFRVRLNNGTGFDAETTWPSVGDNPWDLRYTDVDGRTQVDMIDMNGDGLPDHVYKTHLMSVFKVRLNTGTGFAQEEDWIIDGSAPWDLSIIDGNGHMTVAMIDINGDGLPDHVVKDINMGHFSARLNTGGRFTGDIVWNVNGSLDGWDLGFTSGGRTQVGMIDMNGDGLPDHVVKNYINMPYHFHVRLNQFGVGEILEKITTPLAGSQVMTYDQILPKDSDVPFGITVIKNMSAIDGMGTTINTTYDYSGGLYDRMPVDKKEFLGFREASVIDAGGNRSTTVFYQNEQAAADGTNVLKGRIKEQVVYNSAGGNQKRSVNTYAVDPLGTGRYLPKLTRTDSYLYGGGTIQTAVDYTYDSYGNVTQQYFHGDVTKTGDEKTVITEYTHDLDLHMTSYPNRIETRDTSGTKITEVWNFYDGASSYTGTPTKGNITQTKSWLNGGNYPIITRSYDVYGNITDTYDALWNETAGNDGNHTTIVYDSKDHQFPVTQTQGVGTFDFVTISSYNAVTGQIISQTDTHGQTTTYEQDEFGRISKVIGPNDSIEKPTLAYNYYINPAPPHHISARRRVEHGETPAVNVYTYLDGFGRTHQTKTPVPGNKQQVTGMVAYNSRGLVEKAYLPYFVDSSPTIAPLDPNHLHTFNTYDSLGRISQIITSDNKNTNFAYNGWTQTITDSNGHVKDSVKDAYGQIVEVREHVEGGQIHTTGYEYDTLGNLTKTINNLNQETTISYDSLGRKIGMNDHQMGDWQYQYDGNGNLTHQTDAKLNVSTMTYDSLGRLLTKQTNDGFISYTYDAGSFAKGRLSQVIDSIGTHNYTYDNLGNLIQKERIIDSQTYITVSSYNALGLETSLTYPNNEKVNYEYDQAHLTQVKDANSSLVYTTLAYDPVLTGKLQSQILGNGITINYTYRNDNTQLQTLTATSSLGTGLQDYTYTFDSVGNITEITDNLTSETQDFTYDSLDRLTQAIGPYGTKDYAYDSLGTLTKNGDQLNNSWDMENTSNLSAVQGSLQTGNGRYGNGLHFDGNTETQLLNSEGLSPQEAITIEAWIRPTVMGGDYLISKAGSFQFPKIDSNGTVEARLYLESGAQIITAIGVATNNLWQHYALSYDGTTAKIYVNGTLVKQQTMSGNLIFNTERIHVGSSGFSGRMDEVMVHGKVLSQSTLQGRVNAVPNIVPNQPETPSPQIDGMLTGQRGTSYTFLFQARDFDGDNLKYEIDWNWDEQNPGPTETTTLSYTQGTQQTISHTWNVNGRYTIRSRAIQNVGGQDKPGAWSPGYTVYITTAIQAKSVDTLTGTVGGEMTTGLYKNKLTINETVVGTGDSGQYKNQWGYSQTAKDQSASWSYELGPEGIGGQEAASPNKNAMSSFVNLAGGTSDVDQITLGLTQHGYAEHKDSNGNLQLAGNRWMKYDAENRLVKVIMADGSITDFRYDYEGNRVIKTVTPAGGSPATTLYIGDIYEVHPNGSTIENIHAGSQMVATKDNLGNVNYFLSDHLGSTSLVVDASENIVNNTKYTPFGNIYEQTGSFTNDHQYTGHRSDDSTGLIYMKARYYDPALGRFITPDTIVQAPYDPQSLNRYTYVRNNPINLVDPSGHSWLSKTFKKAYAGLAGATSWGAQYMLTGQAAAGNISNWDDAFRYSYQGQAWQAAAGVGFAAAMGSPAAASWTVDTFGYSGAYTLGSVLVSGAGYAAYKYGWYVDTNQNPGDAQARGRSYNRPPPSIDYNLMSPAAIELYEADLFVKATLDGEIDDVAARMNGGRIQFDMGSGGGGGGGSRGAGGRASKSGGKLRSGHGNVDGGKATPEKALDAANTWLGKGYKEIAPGVYRSADGQRQFRMRGSDLSNKRQGSHVHFESIGKNGRLITENSHVLIKK